MSTLKGLPGENTRTAPEAILIYVRTSIICAESKGGRSEITRLDSCSAKPSSRLCSSTTSTMVAEYVRSLIGFGDSGKIELTFNTPELKKIGLRFSLTGMNWSDCTKYGSQVF